MPVGANFYGNRIGHRVKKTSVVAQADDVTIFMTVPEDLQIIGVLLLTYQMTSGARLNTRKPEAMAAEPRDT